MKDISLKIIPKKDILTILPLLGELNSTTPLYLLKKRLLQMITQNYKCVGMFHKDTLIGICGLWFMTRHYVGKVVEADHVIISAKYRGRNLGKKMFGWIYNFSLEEGYEATELNVYSGNQKAHKFYLNEGHDIYGFPAVKVWREDMRLS